MATVSIFMPEMSLTTGNVLWLRKSSDYSVVNAGGDALTESGTSGWFTATVAETWTEQLSATVVDTNGLIPRAGWIPVGGTTVVEGTAVLDSAVGTQINKIEAAVAGTVTGAGTSTEVFVGPSATLTITVDSSGNRSNVSVT